jgi:hypothetical protein
MGFYVVCVCRSSVSFVFVLFWLQVRRLGVGRVDFDRFFFSDSFFGCSRFVEGRCV